MSEEPVVRCLLALVRLGTTFLSAARRLLLAVGSLSCEFDTAVPWLAASTSIAVALPLLTCKIPTYAVEGIWRLEPS